VDFKRKKLTIPLPIVTITMPELNEWHIYCGRSANIQVGSDNRIETGGHSIIEAQSYCNIETGNHSVIRCRSYCNIKTLHSSMVNGGHHCKVLFDDDCHGILTSDCYFEIGSNCTLNLGELKTHTFTEYYDNCVVIDSDNKKAYTVDDSLFRMLKLEHNT
jgi:hypothetical protein